jgi:hypothetical protein
VFRGDQLDDGRVDDRVLGADPDPGQEPEHDHRPDHRRQPGQHRQARVPQQREHEHPPSAEPVRQVPPGHRAHQDSHQPREEHELRDHRADVEIVFHRVDDAADQVHFQ